MHTYIVQRGHGFISVGIRPNYNGFPPNDIIAWMDAYKVVCGCMPTGTVWIVITVNFTTWIVITLKHSKS